MEPVQHRESQQLDDAATVAHRISTEATLAPGRRVTANTFPVSWAEKLIRPRTIFSFPSLLAVLLIGIVFLMADGGLADPDIWWHLRNAEELLQNHKLVRSDLYSFTVPGHPWVNTEWLAEIPYYLAWRAWGLMGINLVRMALLALIFSGLLYLCYKESHNFKASVVACCFSVFLAAVSFGPRTILFGYGCLIVLLIVLQRLRERGHAPLWLIPPLFCLWVNTHGSWLIGFIVFVIIVAAGCVCGTRGRVSAVPWSTSQLRKLVLTAAASAGALFINPFGARMVFYPFDLAFRQKLNIAHVAEWVSVNFHDTRGKLVFLLLMGLFAGALIRGARWTLAEACLMAFALYTGLTYIRFLFFLGIIAAPVLAKLLDFIPPYQPEIDKPILNAVCISLIAVTAIWYWPTAKELETSVEQQYPAKVIPFLKAHPPDGPMLNFYLWGGYLGWKDRDLKVFVDSRVDIFEYNGVLKDYLDLLMLDKPAAILDKYKIRYVLFPRGEALVYALQHDPGWKVIYEDELSVLFRRTDQDSRVAEANAAANTMVHNSSSQSE